MKDSDPVFGTWKIPKQGQFPILRQDDDLFQQELEQLSSCFLNDLGEVKTKSGDWNQISLKPSLLTKFMINLSIQNFFLVPLDRNPVLTEHYSTRVRWL